MAKKVTTSDKLKLVFSEVLGSDPKDWKRTDKCKKDGREVRRFENVKTDAALTITDMGEGKFSIIGMNININVSIPDAFVEAARKAPDQPSRVLSATVIDTDPARNAAADKAIAILMGEAEASDDKDAEYGVPQNLVNAAGKALANRYCFAISDEDDMISAMITPIRYFEKNGCCDDQTGPIGHLLPKCGELMESTWEIYDSAVKTPVQAAKHLQQQGFVWNRDFQDFIDSKLTATLAKSIAPMPANEPAAPDAAKQPKPYKPAP